MGRFPRVTHPCATRPEGLVRLACVRHAASVRSEPESNSQVDVRSVPREKPRSGPASPGAVPAQKSQSGVFAFLRHMSSSPKPKFRPGSIRNGLNLTDRSIPRGYRRPGRRPHVPSSKPTMSKSRRVSSPGSNVPGSVIPTKKRRETVTDLVEAAAVAGGAIYGWLSSSSTSFFAIFLQAVVRFAEPRGTKASCPCEPPASLL